jgi:hypothetical protein
MLTGKLDIAKLGYPFEMRKSLKLFRYIIVGIDFGCLTDSLPKLTSAAEKNGQGMFYGVGLAARSENSLHPAPLVFPGDKIVVIT